jgi:hypothetical protein
MLAHFMESVMRMENASVNQDGKELIVAKDIVQTIAQAMEYAHRKESANA